MSHKKKGHIAVTKEWRKHLRKYWRRQFWKKHRGAEKRLTKGRE